VGFTHHSEILVKEKSLQGRLFYVARCAAEFWTVDTLKSCPLKRRCAADLRD